MVFKVYSTSGNIIPYEKSLETLEDLMQFVHCCNEDVIITLTPTEYNERRIGKTTLPILEIYDAYQNR